MNPPVKTVEDRIRAAAKIEAFFKDEDVREAIERAEERFIEELIDATTNEKHWAARGKVIGLRSLAHELDVTIQAGEMEVLKIAKRIKSEERSQK